MKAEMFIRYQYLVVKCNYWLINSAQAALSLSRSLRDSDIFLDSSMVEHSAVNRRVVGSSPTRGANVSVFDRDTNYWLRGQAVKTSPFHGGNTGSIPVGVTYMPMWLNWQSS